MNYACTYKVRLTEIWVLKMRASAGKKNKNKRVAIYVGLDHIYLNFIIQSSFIRLNL